MNIATVVEGPTDHLVIMAILDELFPGEHLYLPLQPSNPPDETGTGWKGVRRWCLQTWQRDGSSLDKLISGDVGAPLDLLIIQVDAEIVRNGDLQEGRADPVEIGEPLCPPI